MTTYYVKTDGDDEADGLSWANAWATVNKAATTATGGDTVIYADGTYTLGSGQQSWNVGLDNNIITHQAQNSRQAIWANSADTSGQAGAVHMSNVSYVTLEGIGVHSGGYYVYYLVYLTGDSHHIEFNDVYCYSGADSHGMALRHCHAILVDGCLIDPQSTTYGAREGIAIGGATTQASDITIQDTEISQTSHGGIAIRQCDGVVIDNCHIHDTSSHNIILDTEGSSGIYVDDVEIKNCDLEDSGLWVSDDPPTWNKNGIYCCENAMNIEIHHNDFHDHGLAALFVSSKADGPIYFYNNTAYNCNLNDVEWVGDGYGYVHFYYDEAQTPYLYVKNNIFYVTNQPRCRVLQVTDSALTAYFDADYNLYYVVSSEDQRIRIDSDDYTTLQSYLDDGYEPHTVINDDPDFVDAGSEDFHLLASSPAIDEGVDLGYPYHGTAPDIGAHEYLVEGVAVAGEVTPTGAVVKRVGKVLGGMV